RRGLGPEHRRAVGAAGGDRLTEAPTPVGPQPCSLDRGVPRRTPTPNPLPQGEREPFQGQDGLAVFSSPAEAGTSSAAPASPSSLIQWRTRSASAIREYLPAESRNTMISLRPARLACITRQRPASRI